MASLISFSRTRRITTFTSSWGTKSGQRPRGRDNGTHTRVENRRREVTEGLTQAVRDSQHAFRFIHASWSTALPPSASSPPRSYDTPVLPPSLCSPSRSNRSRRGICKYMVARALVCETIASRIFFRPRQMTRRAPPRKIAGSFARTTLPPLFFPRDSNIGNSWAHEIWREKSGLKSAPIFSLHCNALHLSSASSCSKLRLMQGQTPTSREVVCNRTRKVDQSKAVTFQPCPPFSKLKMQFSLLLISSLATQKKNTSFNVAFRTNKINWARSKVSYERAKTDFSTFVARVAEHLKRRAKWISRGGTNHNPTHTHREKKLF